MLTAHACAVADACQQLNERLAPFHTRLPGAAFKEVVSAAYLERVDLSAHGFHATPNITGAAMGSNPMSYPGAGLRMRTACCPFALAGHCKRSPLTQLTLARVRRSR